MCVCVNTGTNMPWSMLQRSADNFWETALIFNLVKEGSFGLLLPLPNLADPILDDSYVSVSIGG